MTVSLRDRFFTPKVAHAITSPSAIMSTGAGAAIGVLLGLGPIGAVIAGMAAFGVRVAAAIPRGAKAPRIDAGSLAEPWRSLVRDAQQARVQFDAAVARTLPGPLHERLTGIGERISSGIEEAWRTASAGNALDTAFKSIDVRQIDRELMDLPAGTTSPTVTETREALVAQKAAASRMADMIGRTRDQLRLLNAQLDEAVTRCVELSAGTYKPADLDTLEGDVSQALDSMEALRQAVDDTAAGSAAG